MVNADKLYKVSVTDYKTYYLDKEVFVMRVEQSNVNMSGIHTLTEDTSRKETLRAWIGVKRPDFEGEDLKKSKIPLLQMDTAEISDEALKLQPESDEYEVFISDEDKQKISLLQELLEKLTGKKFKFYGLEKIRLRDPGKVPVPASLTVRQRQGWGMEYDFHEIHVEKEAMSFKSSGTVKTADGREISFSVQLNMSREFASHKDISIRAGDAAAVDPLVINFNGAAPKFLNSKFAFDLDLDGDPEQVHRLSSSSGFLALDLNNDGIINDGKELFGPKTGDGFKELAALDFDGNGWIDEGDPIFDRLRIWTKDEQGEDKLFALGMKGVGAIYVGNISTPFDLKDAGNMTLGSVRETGVFLNENGSAGTIQHIDVVA